MDLKNKFMKMDEKYTTRKLNDKTPAWNIQKHRYCKQKQTKKKNK